MKKWIPALMIVALTSCGRHSQQSQALAQPPVRGELIESSPVAAAPAMEFPRARSKRKHPKPPSTQRRMVVAEFIEATQSNNWNGAMPSGTVGTAADLAKTNLPSLSGMTGLDTDVPGYGNVSFGTLGGFGFVLTKQMTDGSGNPADVAANAKAQIPASIQSLDGKKEVIEGFLLPVRMNDGLAVEFLLMRNQSMCCYGVPPKINEWITVKMNGEGVKPVMDQPIAVAGTLHVGPIEENGSLAGIYRLDGDKVIAPF